MKRNKRRARMKYAFPLTHLELLAPSILRAAGEPQPGESFRLTKASGIWSCPNGTLTARLVYRATGTAEIAASIVYQIRNIVVE